MKTGKAHKCSNMVSLGSVCGLPVAGDGVASAPDETHCAEIARSFHGCFLLSEAPSARNSSSSPSSFSASPHSSFSPFSPATGLLSDVGGSLPGRLSQNTNSAALDASAQLCLTAACHTALAQATENTQINDNLPSRPDHRTPSAEMMMNNDDGSGLRSLV